MGQLKAACPCAGVHFVPSDVDDAKPSRHNEGAWASPSESKRPFTTLMFYRILGRNARGDELTYAGRIIPIMQPKSDGEAGSASIRFTGFATSRPAVGETLVDTRIVTDAESFWDHFQSQTFSKMYDYIMERHDGNPRGDGRDAPYFGELTVELTLSEPHYLLDLDKELISTMDALHEDIYRTACSATATRTSSPTASTSC